MNLDRRRLLGVIAGVASGGAGASAFSSRSGARAGATFAADDLTVRTDDGALGAVTVAPAGTVSWSGLETPAGGVALTLYAKYAADLRFRKLAGQRLPAAGLHGEADYAFQSRDLLAVEGFDTSDFDPDDGERATRRVALRLAVTVVGADGETTLTTGYADARFDVTVVNRPESGGVDGRANTAATGDETSENGTTTSETAAENETTTATTTESKPTDTTTETETKTTAENTATTTSRPTATETTTENPTETTTTTATTSENATTASGRTTGSDTTTRTTATTSDRNNTEAVENNTNISKSNTDSSKGRDAADGK
ncbi:hypothetical protein M0R88_12995 [Halorussus gelatinilyticus]|uniref:Uncharacterized protein n=1 Tax=Halorussus gelatinilyticus TaxID=2937524 RepID=A0A8U0IEE2_9EURY|nr:hypothetical protein [Halorussus gelatinilyticus]UPV99436.1 hypothetical protein M0R88_12995 [Halorussus gelatinilyticus]